MKLFRSPTPPSKTSDTQHRSSRLDHEAELTEPHTRGTTILVPRRALVELFARAASAARVAGDRGEHSSPTVEKLAGHIDAIFEEVSGLLGAARLTVEPLPAAEEGAPAVDPFAAADELRLFMGRADALAAATDGQFARGVTLGDADNRRDFRRIAHLVELTAAAVAEASEATDRLIAALERSLPPEEH